jgi:hypothetical protein
VEESRYLGTSGDLDTTKAGCRIIMRRKGMGVRKPSKLRRDLDSNSTTGMNRCEQTAAVTRMRERRLTSDWGEGGDCDASRTGMQDEQKMATCRRGVTGCL